MITEDTKEKIKKMKYNFINLNGEIISTNNLSTIKEGLSWDILNHLKPRWTFKKEEADFLKKYGLKNSVWNIAVLQYLNMVYLFDYDLKRVYERRFKIK